MSWSYLIDEIEDLKSQLSLSLKREERYRKALEDIVKSPGSQFHRDIARTALDEGEEVK